MVDDVLRRQSPETGNWGFPRRVLELRAQPLGGYAWCCGLLITALNQYNEHVQDPRVDECDSAGGAVAGAGRVGDDKQGFRATHAPRSTPAPRRVVLAGAAPTRC